jgi:hypothetical protein
MRMRDITVVSTFYGGDDWTEKEKERSIIGSGSGLGLYGFW